MTRETKIGLLVGLAFIIVIGILLSDHLTSSTEPPSATLVQTGTNVRQTVAIPGGTQPPVTTVVAPAAVTPQAPVPTNRELAPQTPPTAIVQVGGPDAAPAPGQQQPPPAAAPAGEPPISYVGTPQPAAPIESPAAPSEPAVAAAPAPAPAAEAPVITSTPLTPRSTLSQIAAQQGEPLVGLDGNPVRTSSTPATPSAGSAASSATREYTVQAGDSVSRLAARFLGANTKANRDAIIRANPSLQQDPNKLIVGKTYRIPASAGAAGSAAAAVSQASAPAAPAAAARQAAASASEYWYTVKEGDSLWKIANEQLGRGSAVAAIKELNKDILKDGEVVHPNMKLRLPAKPLAQAN